jgi:hypothetical protein
MKKLLPFIILILGFAPLAQATPVTANVIAINNPKVGQSPDVNHFAASTTAFYRISWRSVTVNGASVNYLTSFAYSGAQFFASDNVYGATTYAEIQAKAAALGISNLPADPNAGH